MTIDHRSASSSLQQLLATHTPAELLAKLAPKHTPTPPRVPSGGVDADALEKRWAVLPCHETARPELLDETALATAPRYARNIENFIGTVECRSGRRAAARATDAMRRATTTSRSRRPRPHWSRRTAVARS